MEKCKICKCPPEPSPVVATAALSDCEVSVRDRRLEKKNGNGKVWKRVISLVIAASKQPIAIHRMTRGKRECGGEAVKVHLSMAMALLKSDHLFLCPSCWGSTAKGAMGMWTRHVEARRRTFRKKKQAHYAHQAKEQKTVEVVRSRSRYRI